MTLEISSPAFTDNEPIDKRYTADGEDVSPELTWSGVPAATRELALICDDPDAPTAEPWVHWVIYKIAVTTSGLPEHVAAVEAPPDPKGAFQGKNSWGQVGYRGPAPPPGKVHHYRFMLYALDTELSVKGGLAKSQLLASMKGHILATDELVGTYQR